jgi:hypothetical protein
MQAAVLQVDPSASSDSTVRPELFLGSSASPRIRLQQTKPHSDSLGFARTGTSAANVKMDMNESPWRCKRHYSVNSKLSRRVQPGTFVRSDGEVFVAPASVWCWRTISIVELKSEGMA